MLALSRKKDEAIIINDDIEITIIEIKGDPGKAWHISSEVSTYIS